MKQVFFVCYGRKNRRILAWYSLIFAKFAFSWFRQRFNPSSVFTLVIKKKSVVKIISFFFLCLEYRSNFEDVIFVRKYYSSQYKKDYLHINCIWDKIFKNGPSRICGRQPLKHLTGYGLLNRDKGYGLHTGVPIKHCAKSCFKIILYKLNTSSIVF